MTREELRSLLEDTDWFANLGSAPEGRGFVVLRGLEPWAGEEPTTISDEQIADSMSWLPSSREMPDPLGDSLQGPLSRSDESARGFPMEAYRLAINGLRGCEDGPRFRLGPHDFSGAAKGAALYATRAAATEVAVGQTGRWCEVLHIYADGFWPCGLMSDGRVVVC